METYQSQEGKGKNLPIGSVPIGSIYDGFRILAKIIARRYIADRRSGQPGENYKSQQDEIHKGNLKNEEDERC